MARNHIQRRALLIGVAEQDVIRPNLPVVRKDLQIMQKALESSRFAVQLLGTEGTEAPTRSTIRRTVRGFCADADKGSTLLLYFSGHGVHYNNRDYVIPSDATLDDPVNVEEYLVPIDLSYVIDECRAQTILFFVDACREGIKITNSPKGLIKGLTFDEWSDRDIGLVKERESAIVFSCSPGKLSFATRNDFSFFTRALADVLDATHPARKFREITEALRDRLDNLTNEYKVPNQTVRVCAEFDPQYTLLDREVCDGPQPPMVELPTVVRAREAHQPIGVSTFLQRPDDYRDKSARACVLFTDLYGSTEFRVDHGEKEAIKKTLLHNKVSSDVITDTGGIVVKHISDRVMGVFECDHCEERAVSAGIAIIRRLEQQNTQQGLYCPYDLHTSIGIKSGRIWRFNFEGCDLDDYIGDPVDIAQRLCSLAGMGQLICDEDTFQRIQFPHPDWSYGAPVERFVEGLDEPLLVRLVVPAGRPTGEDLIQLCGFTRWVPDAVRPMLKDLHGLYRGKRFDDVFELCQKILRMDRGNFEASVCCAEILLDRVTAGSSNRFQVLEEIIHRYLCIAKQIRPQANRVWRLLAWAYYLQATDMREEVDKAALLSTAFKRAEMALGCAQDYMDENGEARAKILLALILREQAHLDQSKHAEYLAKANEYCAEVASQLVSFLDRTRSDHLLVQALVQADLGASADTVEKILDQAKTADMKNPRVHEALAAFYRTRGQSAI
jgi:class 3 adenylate cyclase